MPFALAEAGILLIWGWVILVVFIYPFMKMFTSGDNAAIGLMLAIFLPPIAVSLWFNSGKKNAESQMQFQLNREKEKQYSEYIELCKSNSLTVYHSATGAVNSGIVIRDNTYFKGNKGGGEKLAECLISGQYVADRTICKKPKIDFLDIKYPCDNCGRFDRYLHPTPDANYQVAKLNQKFMNLHDGSNNLKIHSAYTSYGFLVPSDAEYELILGKKDDPPLTTNVSGIEYGLSTVELLRIKDQLKLGELKMSFANQASGGFGCSDFYEEVSKLLSAVFKQ